MESNSGRKIINDFNLSNIADSIIVIDKDNYYINGMAIKRIADKFAGIYSIFKLIKLFPTVLIDFVYQIIAKNRYLIFDKYAECPVYINREKLNIEILD
jgi:predicted DCC family thiol-disulfide oxidoreductase YuxK